MFLTNKRDICDNMTASDLFPTNFVSNFDFALWSEGGWCLPLDFLQNQPIVWFPIFILIISVTYLVVLIRHCLIRFVELLRVVCVLNPEPGHIKRRREYGKSQLSFASKSARASGWVFHWILQFFRFSYSTAIVHRWKNLISNPCWRLLERRVPVSI